MFAGALAHALLQGEEPDIDRRERIADLVGQSGGEAGKVRQLLLVLDGGVVLDEFLPQRDHDHAGIERDDENGALHNQRGDQHVEQRLERAADVADKVGERGFGRGPAIAHDTDWPRRPDDFRRRHRRRSLLPVLDERVDGRGLGAQLPGQGEKILLRFGGFREFLLHQIGGKRLAFGERDGGEIIREGDLRPAQKLVEVHRDGGRVGGRQAGQPVAQRLELARIDVRLLLAQPRIERPALLPVAGDLRAVLVPEVALQRVAQFRQARLQLVRQIGVTILRVDERGQLQDFLDVLRIMGLRLRRLRDFSHVLNCRGDLRGGGRPAVELVQGGVGAERGPADRQRHQEQGNLEQRDAPLEPRADRVPVRS